MHFGKSKIYVTSKSYNVYVPSVAAVSVVSSADTVVTSVAPVAASKGESNVCYTSSHHLQAHYGPT